MKNTSKILTRPDTGLAIGSVLGVLFAPDMGAETRKKIAKSGKKLANKKMRLRIRQQELEKQITKKTGRN